MDLERVLKEAAADVQRLEERLDAAETLLSLQGPVHHGEDKEKLYIVEKVIKRVKRNGLYYYRVKWLGFDETTWEPVRNLPPEVVEVYDAEVPRPTRRKSKAKNRGSV